MLAAAVLCGLTAHAAAAPGALPLYKTPGAPVDDRVK